jgi:hypothetical protein
MPKKVSFSSLKIGSGVFLNCVAGYASTTLYAVTNGLFHADFTIENKL